MVQVTLVISFLGPTLTLTFLGEPWWDGWIIDFLRAKKAQEVTDFPSGIVSVPVVISEFEHTQDTGLIVAGTVGFTVGEEKGMFAPLVEAKHSWVLLLPKKSPITPYLTTGDKEKSVCSVCSLQ